MTNELKFTISRDSNGNRVLRVSKGRQGFSIQTNGNLFRTHSRGVYEGTSAELARFVEEYGTPRQKSIVLG